MRLFLRGTAVPETSRACPITAAGATPAALYIVRLFIVGADVVCADVIVYLSTI